MPRISNQNMFKRKIKDDKPTDDWTKNSVNLPFPVYLDYKLVFDFLAIFNDGLSNLEETKTTFNETSADSIEGKVDAKPPLPFAFINVGGSVKNSHDKGVTRESSRKKTHTSVSLFAQLRHRLELNDMIKSVTSRGLSASDFIELSVHLSKLQLVKVFESNKQAIEVGAKFAENGTAPATIPDAVSNFIDILNPISKTNLYAKVGDKNIIIVLDSEFTNDEKLRNILTGEYRVLGKIMRIENDSYNVLGGTDLSFLKPEAMNTIFESLSGENMAGMREFVDLPKKVTATLDGKTIVIKPLAIFI